MNIDELSGSLTMPPFADNAQHPGLKQAFTFQQVADFLDIPIDTVRNAAKLGRLKVVWINQRVARILRSDLTEWIENPRKGRIKKQELSAASTEA
jgi:hypothetical protein